jgi:type I restriction enzyme S subunit
VKVGWYEAALGTVVTVSKKKGGSRPLPYVGLEDISSGGTGRFTGSLELQSDKSTTFEFKSVHVLYGRLRPYLNKVFMPDFEGHCSSEIFPILPSPQLDRQYLFYWITKAQTVEVINATCTGARMPRANISELLTFPIPLPPLEEQQRIVAILDEAFEGLARARAHAEANLSNARELFESFLRDVIQRGQDRWPTRSLKDIADNLDRRRVPITKKDREPGEIPYYGASGVVDHVAESLFDDDLLLVSEDGANLLARTYPIAFSVSGPCWVNNHAHVLRFHDADTHEFVRLYLNSISLEPFVSGMAQPKLSQAALNRIPVPLPDAEALADITSKAAAMVAETDRLQQHYAAAALDLDDLRQSLLQKAFAGELT